MELNKDDRKNIENILDSIDYDQNKIKKELNNFIYSIDNIIDSFNTIQNNCCLAIEKLQIIKNNMFEVECIKLPSGSSVTNANIYNVPFVVGQIYNVIDVETHNDIEYYLFDIDCDLILSYWNSKYFKKK